MQSRISLFRVVHIGPDSLIQYRYNSNTVPADFETHEPGSPRVDLSEGTNARRLLSFLLERPGVGYTPAELADGTDVARGSVGPTLQRLETDQSWRHGPESTTVPLPEGRDAYHFWSEYHCAAVAKSTGSE